MTPAPKGRDDGGPDEPDGPWAAGFAERCGVTRQRELIASMERHGSALERANTRLLEFVETLAGEFQVVVSSGEGRPDVAWFQRRLNRCLKELAKYRSAP